MQFVYNLSNLGSTIATSLLKKDAQPKKIALLKVHRNRLLEIVNVQLRTVRPFIFKQLKVVEHNDAIKRLQSQFEGPALKTRPLAIERFIDDHIQKVLLPEAREQQSGLLKNKN